MWKFLHYTSSSWKRRKKCMLCRRESIVISSVIGVCVDCLRDNPREALRIAMNAHEESREMFNLPLHPPKDPQGVACRLCDLECWIPEGRRGFCGLVENKGGKLLWLAGTPNRGVAQWYYDPLPTNCVAGWFCPASTGLGYPKHAYKRGAERGYYNLAVFYGACNLDCLFCQNWSYREMAVSLKPARSAEELAKAVTNKVSCICFFGGDPSPQVVHALAAAKIAVEKARGRILRICWETNGHFNPNILKSVVNLSLETGGIIKFDLKAWSRPVYEALTGVKLGKVYENASYVLQRVREHPEVPHFAASTLLVPGYVEEYEVRMIARFLASYDRDTPYSLLAFHPDYLLNDLPPTSVSHAKAALKAAREEGLRNVNLGNEWLLGDYY